MKNLNLVKLTIVQGIIMGLGISLYTTFMWLTNLDTIYLSMGQYLDMAIILLPILIIFRAIKKANKSYRISAIKRVCIAICIGFVSFIIYEPFLYVYHHFINPDWFDAVLTLKEIELKLANIPEMEIAQVLGKMKTSSTAQAKLFRLSTLIPSVIIIPSIIALISLIFIKHTKLN